MTRPRHVHRWRGPTWSPLGRARSTCGSEARGATCRAWTTAPSSGGTARTSRSRPDHAGVDRGLRGLPGRRVHQHAHAHGAGRRDDAETLVHHTSKEHRDGHLESGMEGGMQETVNRLDDLLAASDSTAERSGGRGTIQRPRRRGPVRRVGPSGAVRRVGGARHRRPHGRVDAGVPRRGGRGARAAVRRSTPTRSARGPDWPISCRPCSTIRSRRPGPSPTSTSASRPSSSRSG